MVQQINLYDDALRPQRQRWRAAHGLWVVGGTLVLAWGLSLVMDALTARRGAEAERLEAQATVQRGLSARNGGVAGASGSIEARNAELQRLRTLEAGQHKVHDALDREAGKGRDGYSQYFLALSRQAHPSLWITGFGVGADGQSLEIRGRMTDAAVLPDYLRKLNNEPQFKGRSFEQLTIRAAADPRDASLAAPWTEFVLRSQPLLAGTPEAGGGQ